MTNISSYELTEFNLEGQINLDEKCGLIKILRSEDGRLVLITDADFGLINQTEPTPNRVASVDSILGLVMDIGVRREKRLTYSGGFYFGMKLIQQTQSTKKIEQKDFDSALMQKIDASIQDNYVSGDPSKEVRAIKFSNLLTAYNNARLLYPNFHNDSYLGLMRILDALIDGKGACDFSSGVAAANHSLNTTIYQKVLAIAGYVDRLKTAEALFDECLARAKKDGWSCMSTMTSFDVADKFVFSCFYSAYQYRSKFVHQGMPFPWIVVQSLGVEDDSGTSYLHPAVGSSLLKIHRPGGLQDGDSLDIHCIVPAEDEARAFKDKYFLLLPTWHFLKTICRSTLIKSIEKI